MIVDNGDESVATGCSTTTGGASVKGSSEADPNDLSDQQVGEEIMANVAKIQQSLEDTGRIWARNSPADRMMAASACPDALYVELAEQIASRNERLDDEPIEGFACKAKSKKAKSDESDKTAPSKPSQSEKSTPGIWPWGTGNPKKPSSLCVPAASVLMGVLYGARMARKP